MQLPTPSALLKLLFSAYQKKICTHFYLLKQEIIPSIRINAKVYQEQPFVDITLITVLTLGKINNYNLNRQKNTNYLKNDIWYTVQYWQMKHIIHPTIFPVQ